MLKEKLVVFTLFVCLTSLSHAQQSKKNTPLEEYQGATQGALYICKLTYELALSKANVNEPQDKQSDYAGCIRDARTKAKVSLQKALLTVKKEKAKDALKSYHVAFMSALDGIEPGNSERKISYEQRQQALDGKLTEAWARFEVEE